MGKAGLLAKLGCPPLWPWELRLHPPIPLHFPLTCPQQGMGFGKVNLGVVTCAQIHGWVMFGGAEGNPGAGRREEDAGERKRGARWAGPEPEGAQSFGGKGGGLCTTVPEVHLPPGPLTSPASAEAEELYQKRVLTITGICVALLVVGIVCVVAYCKTK